MSEPDELVMSAVAFNLYQWVLREGRVSHAAIGRISDEFDHSPAGIQAAMAELTAMRLLRESPDGSAELVPVSPEVAFAELVIPIEMEIKKRERRAAELKAQLLTLNRVYFESRRVSRREEAIDLLTDVGQVRASLAEAARACSAAVLSAHPGFFSAAAMQDSLPRDLELLGRGVQMRSLYQHSVRVNAPMLAFLARLGDAGYAVRTFPDIPARIVIFDRELAFLANQPASHGAVMVREPAVVAFLSGWLEQAWSSAVPLDDTSIPGYGAASDQLRHTIVRLLANGEKDEVIARRLNISVRTCRRHVADLLADLKASSRFQAGVLAARSGLTDGPDGTDPAADAAAGHGKGVGQASAK